MGNEGARAGSAVSTVTGMFTSRRVEEAVWTVTGVITANTANMDTDTSSVPSVR